MCRAVFVASVTIGAYLAISKAPKFRKLLMRLCTEGETLTYSVQRGFAGSAGG